MALALNNPQKLIAFKEIEKPKKEKEVWATNNVGIDYILIH